MMQLTESHTMSKMNSKPAQWEIHPTVNNALNPLCLLPSSPDADSADKTLSAIDTLDRASQALAALSDGLERDDSRYGDRLILNCVCGALFHASELLKQVQDEVREISFALSPEELAELQAGAEQAGVAPESYASTLVMERLAAMAKKGFFE